MVEEVMKMQVSWSIEGWKWMQNAKWKKTRCEKKSESDTSSRDFIDIKAQFTQKYKIISYLHAGRKAGEVL